MPITLSSRPFAEASNALAAVMMRDDANQNDVDSAIQGLASAITDEVRASYDVARDDRAALSARGFKVLTSAENAYFTRLAQASKTARTVDEFNSTMEGANLPETVIDDVMSYVKAAHPFLGAINMRAVNRVTKMYFNAGTTQEAAWGELDSTITKEIVGSFKELTATQNKLSAFALVARDELELGPTYLQALVVATIGESISNGLEHGFISGAGDKVFAPIGLDRDLTAAIDPTTGIPQKAAVSVTDFTPASYGTILSKLVKDELGREKNVTVNANGSLVTPAFALITNLTDFMTKVMPATTVLNNSGAYVSGLFPVPTSVYTSAYVASGQAILCIPNEYYALVGGERGLEMDDSIKFFEDKRAYKQVVYATGRPKDNTSSVVLDISKLDPAYINVAVKGTVTTKASA